MGIETILIIAAIAMAAMATAAANKGLDKDTDAAADHANLKIKELDRQRKQESKIAQEVKADRVRQADKQQASMIAALADVGGAGTDNESRFAGEIGLYEGLDIARIEGNRRRKIEALHSEQTAARNFALSVAAQNKSQKKVNTFNFLKGAAMTGAGAAGGGAGGAATASAGASSASTSYAGGG